MLIKIAKNGIESEWFQLTKKRHRTLLLEMYALSDFLIMVFVMVSEAVT